MFEKELLEIEETIEKQSLKPVYSWQNGQVCICIYPAFTNCFQNYIPNHNNGIGSPRGHIPHPDMFTAIVDWLISMDVKTICGPILSGAALAYAVSVVSKYRISAVYLLKPDGRYSTDKHSLTKSFVGKYAIIDDYVVTGRAMEVSLDCVRRWGDGREPSVIIADGWGQLPIPLYNLRDNLFTVRFYMEK